MLWNFYNKLTINFSVKPKLLNYFKEQILCLPSNRNAPEK